MAWGARAPCVGAGASWGPPLRWGCRGGPRPRPSLWCFGPSPCGVRGVGAFGGGFPLGGVVGSLWGPRGGGGGVFPCPRWVLSRGAWGLARAGGVVGAVFVGGRLLGGRCPGGRVVHRLRRFLLGALLWFLPGPLPSGGGVWAPPLSWRGGRARGAWVAFVGVGAVPLVVLGGGLWGAFGGRGSGSGGAWASGFGFGCVCRALAFGGFWALSAGRPMAMVSRV